MVPVVLVSGGNNLLSFDFNSQAGVLAVLSAIRASSLATADRNELRDLVFLFANGGGDKAVRTVLEERLKEENITIATVMSKSGLAASGAIPVAKRLSSGFAVGRPMPTFPVTAPVAIKVAPFVGSTSTPAQVVTPVPAVLPIPVTLKAPVLVPVAAALPLRVVPVIPVSVTPVTRPVVVVPRPVAVMPERLVTVVPPPPASPTVIATTIPQSVVPPVQQYNDVINPATAARLERIRTIKSDVNDRVGNPVNLVAMDKTIGTEYMSALLESMKLLSSASEAESVRAMDRLETVYTRVQELFKGPVAPETTPVISPRVVPISVPPLSSAPLPPRPPAPDPVTEWGSADSVADMKTSIAPAVSSVPLRSVGQMSAVASEAPLRSITDLPTADDINNSGGNGDPLFTKEVDSGLQQLLSEWALFKKSGLFGTGPSGREHTLFLKLAPLSLLLILSGRFEGSTQEIKQSITDYMNGWRYEQGIIYEKDETFEHYLRRVIRHIIDLQNKKRGSY